jgi:Zn-dependent metalloprotease
MAQRPPAIHCIIPPFIFESIQAHGSPPQREAARANLAVGTEIRRQRSSSSAERPPGVEAAGKDRIVYSANNASDLPGTPVRYEGDGPSGDVAVDEAYDGSGSTYDLFKDVFGRDSIDGNNMRLDSTVHYQVGYDNAFWNGEQMVYGDGDEDLPAEQRLFNRFTASLDVIGHELTHGVTQYSAGLVYLNQPGALNEHFSDVFGSLGLQRTLGQSAADASWIIGSGLFTQNVNGVGIRSMKAPGTAYNDPVLGKDPQPAHMDDYVTTLEDNGGVHINSGIPNRAFYQAAVGLGGFAWEQAGAIWYTALTDGRLGSQSSFQEAANLTFTIAGELYGSGSAQQTAVVNGWNAVGIDAATAGGPVPGGCLPLGSVLGRLTRG